MVLATESRVRSVRLSTNLYNKISSFASANSLNFNSAAIMLLNNYLPNVNNFPDDFKNIAIIDRQIVRNLRFPAKLFYQINDLAKYCDISFASMTNILLTRAIVSPTLIDPDQKDNVVVVKSKEEQE